MVLTPSDLASRSWVTRSPPSNSLESTILRSSAATSSVTDRWAKRRVGPGMLR
jgi:hypothetical protein